MPTFRQRVTYKRPLYTMICMNLWILAISSSSLHPSRDDTFRGRTRLLLKHLYIIQKKRWQQEKEAFPVYYIRRTKTIDFRDKINLLNRCFRFFL